MERFNVELTMRPNVQGSKKQRGMTLIELMIAMVVLLVGVVGSMALIAYAMGGNGRSKQQSNATVIAQMLTEKISSQKAILSQNLTVLDCTGASNTVYTAAGGGALTSSGGVDFTQAAVTGYQMYYTDCGTSGRQMVYDVRWTITQPTTYTKLVVVSAQMKNAASTSSPTMYSPAVTVRTLIGQGT